MKSVFSLLFVAKLLYGSFLIHAQEPLNLEKCISAALENNIALQMAEGSYTVSQINLKQAKSAWYPNLNGFASNNYNFGQTIDPFTNQFATNMVRSNSFGMQTSVDVFNGFRNSGNLKSANYNKEGAKWDLEQKKRDVMLEVCNAYLRVLLAKEMKKSAELQLVQSKKRLEKERLLKDAGKGSLANFLQSEASLANEELILVNRINELEMAFLSLKQSMNLNYSESIEIVTPELKIDENEAFLITPSQVTEQAVRESPSVIALENKSRAFLESEKVALSSMLPTLRVSASFGTGYSGLRKEVTGYSITGADSIGFTSSGEVVYVPEIDYSTTVQSFSTQLKDNMNQSVGVSLTVPVFNRFNSKYDVQKAKIQTRNSEWNVQSEKLRISSNVYIAWAEANAALATFRATSKSFHALSKVYEFAVQRLEMGMLDVVDFNEEKTRYSNTESELIRAKYNYIFKKKVLEFYQGKSITL